MNKKELYHFLPSLVFLIVLGILALLLFFGPDKDYSVNEKRYLAERPEISVSNILKGKTQEELEEFTADQIPGRDFFVGVNAYWNLATGRNAAQGKDGYLINAPKPYNEEVFTNNLTRFDQFAQSLGIPADIIMVPSTGYLMENELPKFHGEYDDDMLYEKAGEILHYTKLIDVRDALKEGIAEGGQVCYRTDHHLTSLGNYLLYRAYQIDHRRLLRHHLVRQRLLVHKARHRGGLGQRHPDQGHPPGRQRRPHLLRQPLLPQAPGGDRQVPRLPGRQPQPGEHLQPQRGGGERPRHPGLLRPLLQHLPGGQLPEHLSGGPALLPGRPDEIRLRASRG